MRDSVNYARCELGFGVLRGLFFRFQSYFYKALIFVCLIMSTKLKFYVLQKSLLMIKFTNSLLSAPPPMLDFIHNEEMLCQILSAVVSNNDILYAI